jgi:hypothetical protein
MHQIREPGRRVPIPDDAAISLTFANPKRGLVAVAGTTREQLIYLNIAFRNGDIRTVYLDENGAGRLLAALKALVPAKAGIAASPAILEGDGLIAVQEGFLPSDIDR